MSQMLTSGAGAGVQILGGGGGDPYFASVVLLALNENGADGTTTFIDQSSAARTLTAVGNAKWSSAWAPTGLTTSGLFDGTGDKITAPDSDDWNMGTGDFTYECTINYGVPSNYDALMGQWLDNTDKACEIYVRNGNSIELYFWGTNAWSQVIGSLTFAAGDHIAISRNGTNVRTWQNGSQIGTTKDVTGYDMAASTATFNIGSISTLDYPGYMASVRVTKGVGRYESAFTPPTLPLPTS